MSLREPEDVDETWTKIFRQGFGSLAIGGAFLTFVSIIIWLNLDQLGGGLGMRSSNGVTAQYFNWHPLLMSMAFLIFMTPAILSFEIFPYPRHANKLLHAFVNTLALLAAFAGFGIILDCHNNLSSTGSFHTVHGCVGLVVLSLLAINYFLAFVLYGLQCGGSLRTKLKPLHKRLGFCVITLGFANITLGIFEQELKKQLKGPTHQFTHAIAIACIVTLIGVIFTVVKFIDKKDVDPKYTPIADADSTNQTTNQEMEQI